MKTISSASLHKFRHGSNQRSQKSRNSMPILSNIPQSSRSTPLLSEPKYDQLSLPKSIASPHALLHEDEVRLMQGQISLLSNELLCMEKRLDAWRDEFHGLQGKLLETLSEHSNTMQELEDTRRMLQESEHVRSRWMMKSSSTSVLELPVSQKEPKHSTGSFSSKRNKVFRFLKFSA